MAEMRSNSDLLQIVDSTGTVKVKSRLVGICSKTMEDIKTSSEVGEWQTVLINSAHLKVIETYMALDADVWQVVDIQSPLRISF